MKRRALGGTGIMVGEIGLGAWQLSGGAWGTAGGPDALRIVAAALDAGCDFFDTAPNYGKGRSEEILGEALASVRGRVTLCTKFGHASDGPKNFDVATVRPSLEASLRRLRTDYVDILMLHNPPLELMDGKGGGAALFGELERLKTEGKLRVYGVSIDWKQELDTIIETTRCGAVEVLYNAFHQEPGASFAKAAAQGIGVVVKVPLDSGWLSGKYRRDSRFTGIRGRWSPDVIERRGRLAEEFAKLVPTGMSMGHAALKYILAQREVSTIIPGAKSVEQVRDNLAASGQDLPGDVVAAMRGLWEREIAGKPLPW